MIRGRIIYIFGPDGSGKSTHIELLYRFLKRRKARVRKSYLASHHLFAWVLQRVFVKAGFFVWRPSKSYPIERYVPKEVINYNKFSRIIWLLTEVVSVLLLIVKVKLLESLRYIVIVERGLISTLADLVYMFNSEVLKSFFVKPIIALINDNRSIYIYLDAGYDALVKRRGTQAEPKDYIDTQRIVYGTFTNYHKCLKIDTSRLSIADVQSLIRKFIKQEYQI